MRLGSPTVGNSWKMESYRRHAGSAFQTLHFFARAAEIPHTVFFWQKNDNIKICACHLQNSYEDHKLENEMLLCREGGKASAPFRQQQALCRCQNLQVTLLPKSPPRKHPVPNLDICTHPVQGVHFSIFSFASLDIELVLFRRVLGLGIKHTLVPCARLLKQPLIQCLKN